MRLIDADALKELALWEVYDNSDWDYQYVTTAQIDDAPTIEAEPIRQARWKGAGMGDYMCSLCNEVVTGNRYHYCPNCGAKMHGGENG